MQKTKIAIFASGSGSNAKAIIEHSFDSNYSVDLIVSNKNEEKIVQPKNVADLFNNINGFSIL